MPTKKELQEKLESLQHELKEQDDKIHFLKRHIAYLKDRLDEYKVGYDVQGMKDEVNYSDSDEYENDTEE